MRLAVFTSHFPGRINTFFARDVRGLIDAGIDVEVFATHPLDPELWAYVPDLLSEQVLPRHKVHHIGLRDGLKRSVQWPTAWRQAPRLASIAAAAVSHGVMPLLKTGYVVPMALAWARDFGGRFDHVLAYWGNYPATCAYVFHRAIGRDIPFSMFLHAGTDLYRTRVFLGQKLQYADNVFVVCSFNRQFIKLNYAPMFDELAPKIHLHHLGVDLDSLAWRADGRVENRIVAAGGLHPAKGFDDLIRAAAHLQQQGRDLRLVFVGDGPEGPALRALAQQLGVAMAITFSGWRTPEMTLDEIRRAAVLVHPSVGLGDAVPTVIKEAMALGTPVVASAVAGIPELLDEGRCGVLTPPRNPVALAQALGDLLDSPERRAAYARSARARAELLFSQARNGAALAERLVQTRRQSMAAATPDLVTPVHS